MKVYGMMTGRNFAIFRGVCSGVEFLLDHARGGKTDMKNHVLARATTDMVSVVRDGVRPMLVGAGGIATTPP